MRIYRISDIHNKEKKEMLVVSLILITTIFSTNGFPSPPQTKTLRTAEFQNAEQKRDVFNSPEQQNLIFQVPEQQNLILQVPKQQTVFQAPEEKQTIFQAPEEQQVVFQVPEEQQLIFQAPEEQLILQAPIEQKTIIETPVEQGVIFQTTKQVLSDDHFTSGGSELAGQGIDFTISCSAANQICTRKDDCVNGYIPSVKSASYPKTYQCRVQDQVCCTIASEAEVQEQSVFTGGQAKESTAQSAIGIATQAATHVQLGCAAALLCVEEKFCTLDGTISSDPVVISEKQLFRRVPLSSCKNPETGIIGKCCRDPNYVDPWPTGNLPANYSGGFDEQGFPTFLNIAKVKPTKPPVQSTKIPAKYKPAQSPVQSSIQPPIQHYSPKTEQKYESTLIPENSDIFTKTLIPPIGNKDVKSTSPNTIKPNLRCGVRNKIIQQQEAEESKTVFAEIPWQAMVLHSKDRKILCSGALVGKQDVVTAANCISRLQPEDILIKLGEWKLGYELKQEEPLPFQIMNISSITVHPGYSQGQGEYDLAMLHLENPTTFELHINPLCLPESNYVVQNEKKCIATGWGKTILQAHYAGAIMHAVNMDVLSTEYCKERLTSINFKADSAEGMICAAPKEEKNNVCETDVGGPLACQNEQGAYELTGIYSQDSGCFSTNQVAMFAPLDQKWLKETMYKTVPQESQINIEYEDFRKSILNENNQYLPPI